jgi:uncharacterized membrane protein
MDKNAVMYSAVYDGGKNDALVDLGTLNQLHRDELIGKYDAAVIDEENGKPHIVKRADNPRFDVIPEMLGGGTLKRSELKEAAQELAPGQAALIVVGDPTIEQAFDKAVKNAARIAKQSFDTTTDELANALAESAKN